MIVEIIGPAGAGKSTLSKALSENIDDIKPVFPPSFRKTQDIPFFIGNGLKLLSTLSWNSFQKGSKFPSQVEFLSIVIVLNGWHQVIYRKALKDDKIFILDQGPVYMLMILTLLCAERMKPNKMEKWWDHSIRNWAETLDLVIWLDTSLPMLLERIRGREKRHGAKEIADIDAYQYLKSCRQAYESVTSRMELYSDSFKVLRLDSGKNSLEESVEKVIHELHLERCLPKPQGQN